MELYSVAEVEFRGGVPAMLKWKERLYDLPPWILSCFTSALMLSQIILCFFLGRRNPHGFRILVYTGQAVWAAAAVFGILPIITLRAKGRVVEGRNYMHTTALVDTGIYAVVRHPQFLAGVLISLATVLIAQDWVITVLGLPVIALTWLDALKADRYCVEKFGDEYARYIERVPRLNAVAGILRLVRNN